MEGLKGLLKLNPGNSLETPDILVLTETFLTKPTDIEGFYSIHSLARKPAEGRPSGGVSIFYNP